jgi:hypothetical protein
MITRRDRVWRDPEGPTSIEDITILNTDEDETTHAVTEDGVCIKRTKYLDSSFVPDPRKRHQPFLIDPREVD